MFKFIVVGLIVMVMMFAPTAKAGDANDALQNICEIVAKDKKSALRRKLTAVKNQFLLRFNDYYNNITCDGMSLISYADKHKGMRSLRFMSTRLKADTLNNANYTEVLSPASVKIIQRRIGK